MTIPTPAPWTPAIPPLGASGKLFLATTIICARATPATQPLAVFTRLSTAMWTLARSRLVLQLEDATTLRSTVTIPSHARRTAVTPQLVALTLS